jgi:hypothetical protein
MPVRIDSTFGQYPNSTSGGMLTSNLDNGLGIHMLDSSDYRTNCGLLIDLFGLRVNRDLTINWSAVFAMRPSKCKCPSDSHGFSRSLRRCTQITMIQSWLYGVVNWLQVCPQRPHITKG